MKRKIFSLILIATVITAAATSNKNIGVDNFSDPTFKDSASTTKKIIKLYPNPTTNGSITISSNEPDTELYFFIFDLEGTLISQKIIKGRKMHTIQNLKKGVYMYDVFKKDLSIEQGRIIVK